MNMTIGLDCKDGVIAKVKSKLDTRVSYGLNSLIPKNNHIKNLFSCNLANIL